MKKYLEIGEIVRAHGIAGEVSIQYWCDDAEFFTQFSTLYVRDTKESFSPVTIARARPHKNIIIAKIDGVDTAEDATRLRGTVLYMSRDDVHLPEGSHFFQDLIGLTAIHADEPELIYGKVVDILRTGANDVYVIRKQTEDTGHKDYYVPDIPDCVVEVNLENSELRLRPLDGLFE